jgi:hypothetical protein
MYLRSEYRGRECGRGPRPDAAEEEAAADGELRRGDDASLGRRLWKPSRVRPLAAEASLGRLLGFLKVCGFCEKRDRQKLARS